MVNISWCLKQKKGIELVEPNENLSKQYFEEAKETLQNIPNTESKWNVIMAYYACYHALYALLMKAGIKCEIHDCSIELMKLIKQFTKEDYTFLIRLKEKRIQNQYYLKHETLDDLRAVKQFVMKCKLISEELDIEALRKKIK